MEYSLAVAGVSHDRVPVSYRSLRRQTWQIQKQWFRSDGLHGPFAGLLFLCAVIIGYSFILPERSASNLFLLALFGAYTMSTFLVFATLEQLKISYLKFGPTEFRLALVIINALLIRYGARHMIGALKFVNAGAAIGLAAMMYANHRKLWRLDMKHKLSQEQAARLSEPGPGRTIQSPPPMYELGSR